MYLWDLDHGFAGVVLIKKAGDGSKKIKGCWDSIHVVEVQVRYKSCTILERVKQDNVQTSCIFLQRYIFLFLIDRRNPVGEVLTIN